MLRAGITAYCARREAERGRRLRGAAALRQLHRSRLCARERLALYGGIGVLLIIILTIMEEPSRENARHELLETLGLSYNFQETKLNVFQGCKMEVNNKMLNDCAEKERFVNDLVFFVRGIFY